MANTMDNTFFGAPISQVQVYPYKNEALPLNLPSALANKKALACVLTKEIQKRQKLCQNLKSKEYYKQKRRYLLCRIKETMENSEGMKDTIELNPLSASSVKIENLLKKRLFCGNDECPPQSEYGCLKVRGIRPSMILGMPQYMIRPREMPKIFNHFESLESKIEMVRVDRTSVNDDSIEGSRYVPTKKRRFMTEGEKEAAVKEIEERRASYMCLSKAQREMLENTNIKKQWMWIAKRDIIREQKSSVKEIQDKQLAIKKLASQCNKEVKRKLARSLKYIREGAIRAKRIHKDMLQYWKKREKEIQEQKKKHEKIEKEIKKKANGY